MENLNFEAFKNIVKELVSEANCPVCFNTLRSPVKLCINGHGICAKCKSALERCPLCTQPFAASSSKNVLLNRMLDMLPDTCQFLGCEVLLVQPAADHEKWCGYQTTNCKFNSCKWTGSVKDIPEHIKTNHTEKEIMNETNSYRWTKVKLEPGKVRSCYIV